MKNLLTTRRLQGAVGVALFLGILITANFLLGQVRRRTDITQDRLYTLSDGTARMLHKLDRPVTLKFYYSRSVTDLPPPIKNYGDRVADLLKEFVALGKGRVELETYDPKPDSDAEESAQRYGITGQGQDLLSEEGRIFLGLAVVAGAKEAVLPFLSPSNEDQLEYQITRAIFETTRERRPRLGLLTALPVMGGQSPMNFGMPPQRPQPPWFFMEELKSMYEIVTVSPEAPDIPADLDALLVVQPPSGNDTLLYALDQFVRRGGRMLAFLDPQCLVQAQSGNPMMMAGGTGSDLNKLTRAWGVELKPGKVLADPYLATRASLRSGQAPENNSTWLSLRGQGINSNDVTTSSLRTMLLPCAGGFTGQAAAGLTLTPLLQPTASAGFVDAMAASFGSDSALNTVEPVSPPPLLALRLQGKFKTAFPAGNPAVTNQLAQTAALGDSATNGTVVLVADADMLYDAFCLARGDIFGQQVYQMRNHNLSFLFNALEQLTGSQDLIGLRSRSSYERPFDRVLALESRAAEQWRAEEKRLNDVLQDAQRRLDELQRTKDPAQQVILSAEQKSAIEKFRQESVRTRQQLKEVRQSLRRDVELLGLRCKLINLAGVPALLVLFGVARALSRRKK
ncbi:MAG: Gldg family protein [Kiritimatiellaeota bacterium]|nr:Gldg family protein [Kiritimatiellota bacterium]